MGIISAVPGTICTTRISTRKPDAPLRRKRLTAAAARNPNTRVMAVADVTTITLLRASSRKYAVPTPAVWFTASTKLWKVKWTGKKLGVREVISLFGSNADWTIQ